ncbi:MAG: GPR endopeptidase [Clostridia bacterium]|nr:GPR endopeptidase [Clostridia bacterium]
MDWYRTDLAEELRDREMAREAAAHRGELDGILFDETRAGDIRTSTIEIVSEAGAKRLGKPMGRYVTVSFPTAAGLDHASFLALCDAVASQLARLCAGKRRILVCGVGNDDFAADALGVIAVRHVLVTHHLQEAGVPYMDTFADIAAITPGITAKTGVETVSLVRSAVEAVAPDAVLAVDSLAAGDACRLARTVQLSDTGLAPGSGVGNGRRALDETTLGVPVIALGVPTVVDAATLVSEALAGEEVCEEAMARLSGLFVAPKEIDVIAENLGRMIGFAVNRAFHGDLPYEEMAMMS